MSAFENLLQSVGTWQGLNRLQVDPTQPIHESQTRLIITPILAATFLRIDETWSWEGKEQFGSMLIGHDPKTNQSTIHWIDTWHNGRRVMPLAGQFNADGRLVAIGSFAVENGPDWGWRIEIHAQPDLLKIDMFCVTPDGRDDGGVWAEFTRV